MISVLVLGSNNTLPRSDNMVWRCAVVPLPLSVSRMVLKKL